MIDNQMFLIGGGILTALLVLCLGALFFISRKSQKVMESLLMIMTQPTRAKVQDATRVLNTILAGEIAKIDAAFATMRDTLAAQINSANELKQNLDEQNAQLIALADDATKKLATMSQRLDNTLSGLQAVVDSDAWHDTQTITENFSTTVNELLDKINTTNQDASQRSADIQTQINDWIASSSNLIEQLEKRFNTNVEQMGTMTDAADKMQQQLGDLAQSTTDGFNNVKTAAGDYKEIMTATDKMLDSHLAKLDSFGKTSKKQLTSQMNTLTNTANVVGGQVRLAESSIEKQIRKLSDAVEALMSSATGTENSVRGISTELSTLTNRFDSEIKEFATGVVSELKTVSGVANLTLENTKTAAGAFSESVRAMATGVRETLIEMNTAHTQLSGQSANLIKMSSETTAQLQPLSELIEKYYAALPDLSQGSVDASQQLEKIVASLNEKLTQLKSTVSESTGAISDSAIKLEDLAGQSRQQMIDLMSDYAKAVNTMQTLNKQMMVARATAPMDAIKSTPSASYGHVSGQDFLKQAQRTFDKMHEQSMDLTRTAGAEIPDVVWQKYHNGDKTIFSKWLAKMMTASDKKRIRDLMKSDAVFRSQATQFVRSFENVLNSARQTDTPDKTAATLMKTDLGQIYAALHPHI